MSAAATLRLQIEAALAQRIPSALTPMPRVVRPVAATGVQAVDALLEGGLPIGAITEMAGPEGSGRTSLTLSFLAGIVREDGVAAWVDTSDSLDPESAAAAGVDLERLLWVRCGGAALKPQPANPDFHLPDECLVPPPVKKGLHGGGFGPHPRTEVKGMAGAVSELLHPASLAPRCAEPQPRAPRERELIAPVVPPSTRQTFVRPPKPWNRIEQALRATDLLLQAGGFAAIVLDLGSLAPQFALRVPLATWFRFRAGAEKSRASLLLLTQQPCAKSSSELLLRFQPGSVRRDEPTVFTGLDHRVEVERRRFTQTAGNVVPLRKPPQKETSATWRTQPSWAGAR
ncbi:MAG: recombinase RecA [Acidobacteriota bacterium]